MRLSRLQKYILEKCYFNKGKAGAKADFYDFYKLKKNSKKIKDIQDVLHKSLESLVAKDLLTAYGRKTAYKWFVEKVKLTKSGRQAGRNLIQSRQRRLPINK